MSHEPRTAPTGGTLDRIHRLIRSNWLSSSGAAIATLGLLGTVTGLSLHAAGAWSGPYVGILTVIVLPALFVFGLLLVPLGLLVYRRQLHDRVRRLADRPMYLARAVAALTIVNFAGVATVGYTGVSYMSSTQFCGTACHQAMEPEYLAYQHSPHANVGCVACHVGEGAQAFVESKLNGVSQLIGYLTDDYSRPIPTPVHNLRPADETCENCHWPEKYLGTKLMVRPHYREDEAVSAYVNVLLMRTGGTRADGASTGIHWHAHPDVTVEYVATDPHREKIPWVRVRDRDGSERVFTEEGVDPSTPPPGALRRMDCTDCHNRAAHAFERPEDAVDAAIAAGMIDRRLPFVRKHAVEVLRMGHTREGAAAAIRRAMHAAYNADGVLDADTRPALEPAIEALIEIWQRNVYPDRKLFWDSYPDLSAHYGCMRCHEGNHRDAAGAVIPSKCNVCHVVLSDEEEDPAILNALGLQLPR